jgi:pimeloyl-ACP methyl ester carboxylesterase
MINKWNSVSRIRCDRSTVCFIAALKIATVLHADDLAQRSAVVDHTFLAAHDQSEQKYVTIMPPHFTLDQPVSVLIALHGHGSDRWQFIHQKRDECRATRDFAAAHGMLLVSPDYRASTSWMGPAAEADMLQIIQAVQAQHKVQHVILCGGSMGGTGALTFATLHPEIVDGVVALNGTANLVEYEQFQDAIAESFGGSKRQVPKQYHDRSAEFFSNRFSMPLATTTGGRDDVVPPPSVLRLVDSVKNLHSDVLSIHRPDGGHSTNYEDTKRALEFVFDAVHERSARCVVAAGRSARTPALAESTPGMDTGC